MTVAGSTSEHRNHPHKEEPLPAPCPSWKTIAKAVLPHTKLSGGTEKMLRPFSASGWAQVAVTKACSVLPRSHGGSHLSWQSHRKLSLLMWLQ